MADIAPTIPSRLVQIDAVRLGEDVPAEGTITFTLACDLRDPAGTRTLAAGARSVELVNGKAELLLPVHADGVVDQDGSDDWAIVVTKSWHRDHSYAIRVPAGTAPINLASLSPIRELTESEKAYAITSVAVNVVEAATPSGTATLSGGTMSLNLAVPKGDPGDPGPVTTITGGTVTTLEPGQPASATLGPVAGTPEAPTQALNLSIPKGDKGDKGDQGASVVVKGVKASPGDLPASAAVGDGWVVGGNLWVRSEGGQWVDVGPFQGPQGEPGAPGEPGEPGEPGDAGPAPVLSAANVTFTDGQATGEFVSPGTPGVYTLNLALPRQWYNVRHYGAVGDGTTDDTAAILAAVNAGGDNSTIYFPKGKYLLTQRLVMKYDQTLRGEGIDDRNSTAGITSMESYIVTDVPGGEAVLAPYNTQIQDLAFIAKNYGVGTGLVLAGSVITNNVSARNYNIGIILRSLFYGSLRTVRTIHNKTAIVCEGVHNTTLIDARINCQQPDGTPGVGIVGSGTSVLNVHGSAIENHAIGVQMVTGFSINMVSTYFESSPPTATYPTYPGAIHVMARDVGECVINMTGGEVYIPNCAWFIDASGASSAAKINVTGVTYRGSSTVRFTAIVWANNGKVVLNCSGDSWQISGTASDGNQHQWAQATARPTPGSTIVPPVGAGGLGPAVIHQALPGWIERGTAQVSVASGASLGYVDVTFTAPFVGPPASVVATLGTAAAGTQKVVPRVASITNTGFRCFLYVADATNLTSAITNAPVNWVAVL